MGRIFLSYHGHDEGNDIALHLRAALMAAGYEDVHAYTAPGSGPEVSLPWQDSLRRELLGADALIVITSPGSFSEWCVWESSVFRDRKPHAPCVEFFSARSRRRAILNNLQAQQVDATDPASLAAAGETALRVLERAGVGKAAAPASPFPGLLAFGEHQASLFFGRDDDVRRMAEPLLGRRTFGALAVIGPSGAGKSSIVRAGLIPLLRREGWTIIGPFTPLQGVVPAIEGPPRRVVVLDQAEELLAGDFESLVERLVAASRGEAWVVCTIRADFLDELMNREEFAPLLRDTFLVTPLTKAEIPAVVNGPLRALGWSADDAALGLIQEDASRESMPLLAFALASLWRHVNPDGLCTPRPITRAEYVASGRVMDVLHRQADEAFAMARDLVRDEDGSWPSVHEAERRVLRTLRRLVTVDESGKFTRRAVPDLSARDRQLLDPFVTNRVLVAKRETLEVAHESLFVHWPRLRDGLEHDHAALLARREVEGLAADWVKHPDQLITPSRLDSLLSVLSPTDDELGGLWAQLEETVVGLQFSAEAVRLLRLSLQRRTDDEVRRATTLDSDEVMRTLAGDLPSVRSLLHAPDLSGWRRSLLRAMAATHWLRTATGHVGNVLSVDWSPDDTKLATGSRDGTVRVWDAESGTCLHIFEQSTVTAAVYRSWAVHSVAWSPTGNTIASVSRDRTLRFWSVDERREVKALPLPSIPSSVRFSENGRRVLVACTNGEALMWEIDTDSTGLAHRTRVAAPRNGQVEVWDADMSHDGNWVAVAASDGRIDRYATDGHAEHVVFEAERRDTETGVRSVRFHPRHHDVYASGGERLQGRAPEIHWPRLARWALGSGQKRDLVTSGCQDRERFRRRNRPGLGRGDRRRGTLPRRIRGRGERRRMVTWWGPAGVCLERRHAARVADRPGTRPGQSDPPGRAGDGIGLESGYRCARGRPRGTGVDEPLERTRTEEPERSRLHRRPAFIARVATGRSHPRGRVRGRIGLHRQAERANGTSAAWGTRRHHRCPLVFRLQTTRRGFLGHDPSAEDLHPRRPTGRNESKGTSHSGPVCDRLAPEPERVRDGWHGQPGHCEFAEETAQPVPGQQTSHVGRLASARRPVGRRLCGRDGSAAAHVRQARGASRVAVSPGRGEHRCVVTERPKPPDDVQ